MDLKEINQLIELMNKQDLVEIEVEKDGMKIRLKRKTAGMSTVQETVENENSKNAVHGCNKSIAGEKTENSSKAAQIKSPMIGTFYRAPHPEANMFVEIGDTIEPGQVICIIEAMKLMNEIKAEAKGKVLDVLVNNGDPVEFGQPLFLIEQL